MKFNRIYSLVLVLTIILFCAFKPEDKLVRKAMRLLEKGNLKEAKVLYVKALEKNPNNYKANLGLGLLMSELLANYSGAQPFLEKAYKITEQDTVPALMYALAKCYQHNGEFEKAISYFNLLDGYKDVEEEIDLEKDIKKRINDCNYAIAHKNYDAPKGWYLVNAGKSINTDMPEYVPVLTPQNELIFTSRRKDDSKEKLSYLDGKYFESMYISKIDHLGFKEPRRYTLPDQFSNSKFLKRHESIVSMSADGKKLFTFHDNKIFEINADATLAQKPKKVLKTINFDYYQNHAFLTRDGNTLYFTSEAEGGLGGLDIYKSAKIQEGIWGAPENVGPGINTAFDEDAPFVTADGKVLYFASLGHEGYGNFDIYKCELIDGKWGPAINLGQPINSSGHDIFMVEDSEGTVGYFSSSRNGGYGDMDIYKVNYLNNLKKDCPSTESSITSVSISDANLDDYKNKIEVKLSSNYKILGSEWKVNDVIVAGENLVLDYDYKQEGNYKVTSKTIVYCDTCLSPIVACKSIENKFGKVKSDTTLIAVKSNTSNTNLIDLDTFKGQLSLEQLTALGFNNNSILFDFDKSELSTEALTILSTNSSILKKYPRLVVEIIGFTDARGTENHNKALSAQRAKNVKKNLTDAGVVKFQIKDLEGKGAKELVNDCGKGKECDEETHRQNRRVIFKVFTR